MVTTADLIKHVDLISREQFKKEWMGSIKFKVNFGGCGPLQEVDICSYMASGSSFDLNKLYVDTLSYPPPAKGLKKMPPKGSYMA